jgi:uncharacterized paraquat-inducible protein A
VNIALLVVVSFFYALLSQLVLFASIYQGTVKQSFSHSAQQTLHSCIGNCRYHSHWSLLPLSMRPVLAHDYKIRQADLATMSRSNNESLALKILQSRNSSKSDNRTLVSVKSTTLEAGNDEAWSECCSCQHSFAEDQSEADVEAQHTPPTTKGAAGEQDPNLVNKGSCRPNHQRVLTFLAGYL